MVFLTVTGQHSGIKGYGKLESLAGYVCVVRSGTAQDQAFQGWIFGVGINFLSFCLPFPSPYHGPTTSGSTEEDH